MALRVLLIKCRSQRATIRAWTPPLGPLYLASYLRERLGAEVRVADTCQMNAPSRDLADSARQFAPNVVGLSGMASEIPMMREAATIVRSVAPGALVVAGGPSTSADARSILEEHLIDVAVLGEGELTLADLAQRVEDAGPAWRNEVKLPDIPGIAWLAEDGEVAYSSPRPLLTDLDSLPEPAWDTIDLPWFWSRRSMSTGGIRPYLPIFSSRGCPYRCSYCHNLFGERFRARSARSVVDEIDSLSRRFRVTDFEFLDDVANFDRRRFKDILQGLLDRGLHPKLHFSSGVRADILDDDDIRLLKAVGTGEVSIAIETASPRLQALSRKRLNLDRAGRNIDLMADARIFMRGFFMLGFPTETEQEMLSTVEYAIRSRIHLASFQTVTPFPGTALHQEYVDLGLVDPNDRSMDHDVFSVPVNASQVPDKRFGDIRQQAYARFYGRPGQVLRILRDRPYRTGFTDALVTLAHRFDVARFLRIPLARS